MFLLDIQSYQIECITISWPEVQSDLILLIKYMMIRNQKELCLVIICKILLSDSKVALRLEFLEKKGQHSLSRKGNRNVLHPFLPNRHSLLLPSSAFESYTLHDCARRVLQVLCPQLPSCCELQLLQELFGFSQEGVGVQEGMGLSQQESQWPKTLSESMTFEFLEELAIQLGVL